LEVPYKDATIGQEEIIPIEMHEESDGSVTIEISVRMTIKGSKLKSSPELKEVKAFLRKVLPENNGFTTSIVGTGAIITVSVSAGQAKAVDTAILASDIQRLGLNMQLIPPSTKVPSLRPRSLGTNQTPRLIAIIVGVTTTATLAGAVVYKLSRPAPQIVRTEPEQQKPAPVPDDRQAVEYVLRIGGKVRVKEKDADIGAIADLPGGPLELTKIVLLNNDRIDDAGLANFQNCKDLKHLELDNTAVTDAGMAVFKGIKTLEYLGLGQTGVTDAGLVNFKDCENLTYIGLFNGRGFENARVGDAGMASFKNCTKLRQVQLGGTRITDETLAQLKKNPDLELVSIWGANNITAAGIAALQRALPKCKINTKP
jgi:hypothetical protein